MHAAAGRIPVAQASAAVVPHPAGGGYGVLDGPAGKDPITWGVPGIPGGRGLSPPAVARSLENPAGGDGRVPRHDARGGGERQVLCANPDDPASVERLQLEREVGNRT